MWRTSTGTRTLVGSEAELVRQLLAFVYFQINVACPAAGEPFESGVSLFDRLEASQQLALLAEVGQGLLSADQPPPKLSSLREATVSVLFEELRACVADEVDCELEEESPNRYWRRLIVRVCIAAGDDEQMEDLFADAIPERGRQLKRFLGIDDDYFRDIAPDPTAHQLDAVRSQLDALTRKG